MFTLATIQTGIIGNVATSGYVLGGLVVLGLVGVLFLGLRLFRGKTNHGQTK
ncbi:hypothetical protein [Cryobacterium sp. Y57]|uniref:hypothetical protein n=1 Tax=Cryobacterium sp. Y57 TaxID=2048287 RepID=UPI0013048D4B|nr:hypothetical protein [Cryobacterium sp. Y57]